MTSTREHFTVFMRLSYNFHLIHIIIVWDGCILMEVMCVN